MSRSSGYLLSFGRTHLTSTNSFGKMVKMAAMFVFLVARGRWRSGGWLSAAGAVALMLCDKFLWGIIVVERPFEIAGDFIAGIFFLCWSFLDRAPQLIDKEFAICVIAITFQTQASRARDEF